MEYTLVKWLHILSSTMLFGTGIGSAFYLLRATLGREPRVVAAMTRYLVGADWIFTGSTAVLQPLTGLWLVHLAGFPFDSRWLLWTYVLYVIAIGCWLPVVGVQIRLRDVAAAALRDQTDLPPRYWRLFRWWFALGMPAFFSFLAIFYLMVAKPA